MSKIVLKRQDTLETEEVFDAGKFIVNSQDEILRHRLAGMKKGEFRHTLVLAAGWTEQTREIEVEVAYFPKSLVKEIPDTRLYELNPVVEPHDRQIVFRDAMNRRELGRIEDLPAAVTASAVSKDRRRLLAGMEDGQSLLWEMNVVHGEGARLVDGRKVETKLLQTFSRHESAICCLAFSPDGRTVVSGGGDGVAMLWEVRTGNRLRSFAGHDGEVKAVAISPDGKKLFSGGEDSSITMWDMLTGAVLHSFEAKKGEVTTLVLSPDGKWLVSGDTDHSVQVWDIGERKMLETLPGHQGPITVAVFSGQGETLLTADATGVAKNWEFPKMKEIRSRTMNGPIREAGFSPRGQLLYALTESFDLKTWDAATGDEVLSYCGHKGYIAPGLSFSKSGELLVTGSADKSMRLWDVQAGKLLRVFEHSCEVWGTKFVSGDTKLIGQEKKGEVYGLKLWDIETEDALCTMVGHKSIIWGIDVAPDGQFVASASLDATIKLWSIANCKEVREFKGHAGSVYGISFSPDGKLIASGSIDETIKLWDVPSGREIRTLEGHELSTDSVAFSLDGQTLLSGGSDNNLKLWDVSTGNLIRTFTGHADWVKEVAFSPDGKTAASASEDDTVKLWDVATGQVLRDFTGNDGDVLGVAFSPDGKWAASGGHDGVIRIWWTALEPEGR